MRLVLFYLLALTWGGQAAGQSTSYPSKPIRFIVPFAAGGSTSILSRLVGDRLTRSWGQQVLVDNRPGGNTIIGTEAMVKSPADGHTILFATTSHVTYPQLTPAPYDALKDFATVATIGNSQYVLVLNAGVPANTLVEFIDYAKARPGQLNFSSPGGGGMGHLAGEMFNILAGVKIQNVSYKGSAPAVTDLVGGQVQVSFVTPINVMSHIKSGKLKALAITGKRRMDALPQMPTFAEGGLPSFEMSVWFGVLAPAATPNAIISKLSAEISRFLTQPDVAETLASQGMDPFITTPEQFSALMKADYAKYARVIETAKIKLE